MRQIVLDTETTGLQVAEGHRIIEIGCIELINRKFTGKRYHQYINPLRPVEESALSVHGITNQFLESKPQFSEIMEDFFEFIRGAELIIHNAPFDVGFIDHERKLAQEKGKSLAELCQIIDTLKLARQLHAGQRNSLDALCKRYRIDNTERNLHGALLDADLLAQVYLAMTGGQGSLFDGLKSTVSTLEQARKIQPLPIRQRNLIILRADASELMFHEQQLLKMSEKGKCLWLTILCHSREGGNPS